jgi:hypothetical protein
VTNQALPGRPPAHDLSAFDLSKRSPEQVARSFARWKAQRKRQAEAGPARAEPLPSPQAAGTGDAAPGESTPAETKRASAKQASTPQYSAPFSDLLAAGSEPTVQRTEWPPVAAVRPPQRTASPGRRLKVMSILAGAASVFALAGGALLELADWRDPAAGTPQMAHVRPKETPMALAAPATSAPAAGWTLQHTVDVALMKAAPAAVRPAPQPPTPAVQTASKTVPVAGDKPVLPERKNTAPETVQFVAKPYVPNAAPTLARSPVAQVAAPIPAAAPVATTLHVGDPRPDALIQHGRDNRDGTMTNRTVTNRGASSGKPAAVIGTGSAVDARSPGARKGTAASSVSGDPRGEGSGGARVGVAGEVGAGTASDVSGDGFGGDTGTGDASDVSGDGGASGGSSSTGPADGGDAPGAGTEGGTGGTGPDAGDGSGASAGDGGTGDTGAGGGDAGGDESGDASDGGDSDAGEDGESSGIGGAIGGALDAVGDALGGGKGNPDSNDKDQRN